MNRTIKFRAWDIARKKTFFPSSINWKDGALWVCDSYGDNRGEYELTTPHDFLMQFTGLLDKNGEEIYENDLIECYSKSGEKVYTYPHIVELPDFYREIWSENENNFPAREGEKINVLVVGNVYQNPELLPPLE